MCSKHMAACIALAASGMGLGGCAPVDPPYGNHYLAHTGANTADLRNQLMPETCLDLPADATPDLLPPGCANQLNLLRMVQQPEDLVHGRAMGPALAAPAADAVQHYLQMQQPEERRRVEDQAAIVPAAQ
jgi:hypothetical protein